MQKQSTQKIKTFSIGFSDNEFNEAEHAKAVAAHLGTDHTELYVTGQQALDVVPKLASIYDEPFSDSSQIPTFLVSELARQHVTVSLSGDGGDELFCGYNRYQWAARAWRLRQRIPGFSRGFVHNCLQNARFGRVANKLQNVLPKRHRVRLLDDKLRKLAGVLDADSPLNLYQRLVTNPHGQNPLMPHAPENFPEVKGLSFTEQMMYHDLTGYLPNDILTKVDRASMAVSLEARVPLLDHRVAEFAWHLPPEMKLKGGVNKWLLREVLYQYVPKKLIDRPKMGFGVPMAAWLRGPLKDWAEDLLRESVLEDQGFLDAKAVRRLWQSHQSGQGHWQYQLWSVLMFQSWLAVRN